jgi:two-component system phosphate regulon sensor histidine kinase PhoR
MAAFPSRNEFLRRLYHLGMTSLSRIDMNAERLRMVPYAGVTLAVCGTLLVTLCLMGIDRWLVALPNPGMLYLPLVALLGYHWGIRYALASAILQLLSVSLFFLPTTITRPQGAAELVELVAVTGFVLLLTQLARYRHASAQRAVERLALLNQIGTALVSELEEERLLHLIAQTACTLTGAGFAAFTMRPRDELGRPTVPSEGHLFHLAAVVGVTEEQERLFRQMPLGGEGLLAPIFRQGVPVLVADALDYLARGEQMSRDLARQAAFDYAQGQVAKDGLRGLGVPHGHPIVRSFLGVPLLDRHKEVHGGLLLGHAEPGRFLPEHEQILVGLASQASVALENARLYRLTQMRAQELHAIFESIADGVVLVDASGKIVRENRAACHVRNDIQDAPEGGQAMQALLHTPAQQALAGESSQERTVCVTDVQNERREYVVSASPLHALQTASDRLESVQNGVMPNGISGVVVTWHDVTEERRLEEERRLSAESEAQRTLLQLVLDELPCSVYLVQGHDARLVLANQMATTVWGATWKPGQPMSEFLSGNAIRVIGTDGLEMAPERLATLRAVKLGENVHQHQEVIRHPDSTSLPVLVNAVVLDCEQVRLPLKPSDPVEPVPVALVVHQDVTALKEAEQLKDDFIGIAAHELRTPLAVLKGFAQMLLIQSGRGKGPTLVDWQIEALQGIDQATHRLVELTEDLLDVTRLQAGRLTLHLTPTDLVALTTRVVRRLQLTTDRHTLSLTPSAEHIVVEVDPQRMEQVLSNLLGNAIKYSPQGGPIEIIVRGESQEHLVQLSIRDHGIGIPAEQQAQIFGRFVRADNARVYGIGGTGLGLYLCRELVERQCGRIWFESVEGEGSTFSIALPIYALEEEKIFSASADRRG